MAAAVSSRETGAVEPAPRMFSTLFGLLDVAPADAVMVGDSVEEDVKGAVACGARPLGKKDLTPCLLSFTVRDVKHS